MNSPNPLIKRHRSLRSRVALFAGLLLGMATLAPAAHAHDRHGHRDFGRVIQVKPVYHYVNVRRPHRQCNFNGHGNHRGHNRGAAPIVGGIVGGVIGNRLGNTHRRGIRSRHSGGHGRRGNLGATVAGAIIGAAIGNGISHSNHRYGRHNSNRHCGQVHGHHQQRQLDYYQVTYVYQGRQYHTRSKQHPGHRIRVSRGGVHHRH